jgi:phage baseplate assembly protein W
MAVSRGIPEEIVEEVVHSLLEDGQCYEPRIGIIKLVG